MKRAPDFKPELHDAPFALHQQRAERDLLDTDTSLGGMRAEPEVSPFEIRLRLELFQPFLGYLIFKREQWLRR